VVDNLNVGLRDNANVDNLCCCTTTASQASAIGGLRIRSAVKGRDGQPAPVDRQRTALRKGTHVVRRSTELQRISVRNMSRWQVGRGRAA